ncbi:hypothetical protein SAMN05192559_10372 [Halobacillus karajensis]|uniref:Uncharacterized protein n=1 Tax=Halobacillus karajensis TaxID=195088 RepID=A0A024P2G1_9BACI|nr:hypothetical protein [Halobacillus karajensis]CDQ19984.1 hypothetical protein BN982_02291 [Halobacillus karajensis]CDQ22444.1 hypothetical protein BN983_00652 [Halobacillus karajensis]CDQ28287.1 hypothetical protein BN981_02581 [Halobacillus karajensis]SEH68694.1 hypothetical protein SAMN05192559_10372 [Halobacillus karajensis]
MELIELYPWLMPSLVLITVATLIGSYFSFKAEKFGLMMAIGMVQTFISTLLASSVGPLIFGIGLTQFYVGIVNMKRVKAMSHE